MAAELLTNYLKDYSIPLYTVEKTELWIELGECVTVVKSALTIRRQGDHDKPLVLNGCSMRLLDIAIDDEHLMSSDYGVFDDYLEVRTNKAEFVLTTTVEINPSANKSLTGLYRSNSIYCTQCESHGFRNITYHIDRPDVLSVYTVTITADLDDCPVLLSNGNIVDAGKTHVGKHWVKWHDPHPKPTYLFAMVAGSLEHVSDTFVTRSGRKVSLEVYVESGKAKRALFAVSCLKKSMAWDEKVFNREYDLDVYMIVAVNDFNFGAMENKGLNIFNDKYILASGDTATDNDFLGVDVVVAHEYFHNWSGNRVTCRDWFQLSLKEGLTVFREQKYTEDVTCPHLQRVKQAKIIEEHQFKEDQGPMSHAIRPSSYVDMNNFYTVTVYNKGSEVIRMLETLSSQEKFVQATDAYFAKFDGQAVTTDDFVDVMQDQLKLDLSQFRLWYDQAGTPIVQLDVVQEDGFCKLLFKQLHKPTFNQKIKASLHIPIKFSVFNASGVLIKPEGLSDYVSGNGYLFELKAPASEIKFSCQEKVLIAALDSFSAPVVLHDNISVYDRLLIAQNSEDGYQKFKQMQKVHMHCIDEWLKCNDSKRYSMLSDLLVDAHENILMNSNGSESLVSEILTLPSESFVLDQRPGVCLDNLISVMKHFRAQLSERLSDDYLKVYDSIDLSVPYHYSFEQLAKRSLKNYCLYMLNISNNTLAQDLAHKQFVMSDNMTDKVAALSALSLHNSGLYQTDLSDFYKTWQKDPLIIDKWLSLQAVAPRSDALTAVKALLLHEAYDGSNPNRVRALVGAFCQRNFSGFHGSDGAAYNFLADQVIAIQSFNPQLAARMLAPFLYWSRYDSSRQEKMLACLRKIQKAKVADCVMEPVVRALSD